MLRRILYVSRIAEGVTDQVLRLIIASAQMNNRRNDLSGVLALGPGLFAQVLEGAAEAIELTLARILEDKRHFDVRVLSDTETDTRFFDRWSMELLVDETSANLATDAREGACAPDELLDHLRHRHAQDPMYWPRALNTLAMAT